MDITSDFMEYYHINCCAEHNPYGALNVGSIVSTSKEQVNPYYQNLLNGAKKFNILSTESVPILKFFHKLSEGEYDKIIPLRNHKNVAKFAYDYLDQYIKFARETHFENVRRIEFPDLPSRQHCIWLAKNYDDVCYWQFRLPHGVQAQILRVEVKGVIFVANEGHLIRDAEDTETVISRARAYWQGNSADEEEEVLLEGRMKVLEVLPAKNIKELLSMLPQRITDKLLKKK